MSAKTKKSVNNWLFLAPFALIRLPRLWRKCGFVPSKNLPRVFHCFANKEGAKEYPKHVRAAKSMKTQSDHGISIGEDVSHRCLLASSVCLSVSVLASKVGSLLVRKAYKGIMSSLLSFVVCSEASAFIVQASSSSCCICQYPFLLECPEARVVSSNPLRPSTQAYHHRRSSTLE